MHPSRKKPFSGKLKKQQLKEKRERKRQQGGAKNSDNDDDDTGDSSEATNEELGKRNSVYDNALSLSAAPHQASSQHHASTDTQQQHHVQQSDPAPPERPAWLERAFENARMKPIALAAPKSEMQAPIGAKSRDDFGCNGTKDIIDNALAALQNLPKNRLKSIFDREDPAEIERRKENAHDHFQELPQTALEVSMEDLYGQSGVIQIPRRPPWDYSMKKEVLEYQEARSFTQWLDHIYSTYKREDLSYFEHNLEVWRQLWRVVESSDVVLIVADIRHPVLHFPPALFDWVVRDMKRHMILVFNKADLVAPETLYAWTKYFEEKYPTLKTCKFSCYADDGALRLSSDTSTSFLRSKVRRPKKRYHRAMGARDLLAACRNLQIHKAGVEIDWDKLIDLYPEDDEDLTAAPDSFEPDDSNEDEDNRGDEDEDDNHTEDDHESDDPVSWIKDSVDQLEMDDFEYAPKPNMVTIGIIGHPNVGKSSLINSLMGKTVVSASKTPGHTKHFQTIHISPEIISGLYPIAHVQEPYSSVQYLAERLRLVDILQLRHPREHEEEEESIEREKAEANRLREQNGRTRKKKEATRKGNSGRFRRKRNEPSKYPWSAWDICEAFAIQRGFFTAKAGRPDVYRAANAILRLTSDGRILLSHKPPGYFANKYLYLRRDELNKEIEEERGHSDGDSHADSDADATNEDDGSDTNATKIKATEHRAITPSSESTRIDVDFDREASVNKKSRSKKPKSGFSGGNSFQLLDDADA